MYRKLIQHVLVLEERANFVKETANGLYGALPFVLANSIVTIPFACSTLFVLIMYWGIVSPTSQSPPRKLPLCLVSLDFSYRA
jgi:hypothetical protein